MRAMSALRSGLPGWGVVIMVPLLLWAAAGVGLATEDVDLRAEATVIAPEQLARAQQSKASLESGKISHNLLRIFQQHRTEAGSGAQIAPSAGELPVRMRPLVLIRDGGVVIDVTAEDDPVRLRDALIPLGLKDAAVAGRVVSGVLPLSAIPALNTVPGLRFAEASYAVMNAGAVTSQGDRAMWADQARQIYGVDGSGVTVGVLSDSFNCRGGYEDDVRTGDLPAGVTVLEEGWCGDGIDEGRAMAQLVHDVAPGAALAFHTAFNGMAGFAQGIVELSDAGAAVIVDDVRYVGEPMFQDGVIAQAVDEVAARGVSVFSAAGNQARRSYESKFRPVTTRTSLGRMTVHDFDPGAKTVIAQKVKIPDQGMFAISFQWDEPFASVSGAPGSRSDLDLHFFYRGEYIGSCNDPNIGGDPLEACGIFNDLGKAATVTLVIERSGGPTPQLIKYVDFGNAKVQFATKSGTCFGHANAQGAAAVGAAYYRRTPAYGAKEPELEAFSSAGGVPILLDTRGEHLVPPIEREAPWIVAPDGTDTTFFGRDTNHNGWPNFYGTSAAAPHAAAVAALMLEESPALTPKEIFDRIAAMGVDMGPAGEDRRCGHGLIDAEFSCGCRPWGYDLTGTWKAGTVKQACKTSGEAITCSKLSGTLSVVNVGNAVSKPAPVGFYLSEDEVPDAAEQVLVKTFKSRLARDGKAKMSIVLNLNKLTDGASVAGQHLIAVINPEGSAKEPTDNNIIVGDIP